MKPGKTRAAAGRPGGDWRVGVCLVLWTWVGPVAGAQDPPRLFGDLEEFLEVRVVNVEVVVTDRRDERVLGLEAEDFRLQVDGVEVPIDYFTEVLGGSAVTRHEGADDGVRGVPALVSGEAVGTSYLVFIDEFFSLPRDRDRVMKAMVEALGLLGPEDRMAVVAYDGSKLEMLTTWTQSARVLEQVFRQAGERRALGLKRALERRDHDFRSELLDVPEGFNDSSRLNGEERDYIERLTAQVQRLVLAASSTLRGFASPPGRKVMLLLAGGWPFRPLEFALDDVRRSVLESHYPRGENLYRPLVDTANLLGYTLYPVDLPGFQGAPAGFEPGVTVAATTTNVSFLRERELHDSLSFLATETGGRAFLNARRDRSFPEVVSDTRSFYWLGFVPTWEGDDEGHRIKIEVRTKGLKVRSRSGYEDLSRNRAVGLTLESGLLFGNPPTSDPLQVEFGQPKRSGVGKVDIPMTVRIPLDAVTLIPTADGHVARLDLRMAVLDEFGGRSDIPVIPVSLSSPEAPRPGQLARYETTLRLRKKRSKIVVAIHDRVSGTILSASAELAP